MFKFYHECTLPIKDTSGLPKLPPNATCSQRFCRQIRKLFILNPNHFKCKALFRNKSAIMEERKRHATSRYYYVIHPLSKFNMFLEILFFISWMFTLICDPLAIWLVEVKLIQRVVMIPIRLMLIAFFFIIGYIDDKTKHIVIEPKRIAKKYLKTYFIFDLVSCYIPEFLTKALFTINLFTIPLSVREPWMVVVVIVQVLACCVRINTLLDFFSNALSNLHFNETAKILLVYLMRTYIFIHVLAMFLFITPFVIHSGKWPKASWLYQADIKVETTHPTYIYLEALLVSTCFFFGVSYKYEVELFNEQVVIVFTSFFGRLYTLYLLADVLRIFGIAGVSESMYERNMYILQQYMTEKDLPKNLRNRMLRFYEFKFQRRYFQETEIINTLSETLRTDLFLYSARKLIQKVDILKKLPNATVGAIIASMKSETYSPRDIIIKMGWETNEIYFISSGTVTVMDKQGFELCHLEDGDEFGINCLISKDQTHTIVAVETTEVFIIGKNQLLVFLLPYPDLMNKFIRTARQKLSNLKDLEVAAARDTVDILSELNRGNILETRSKRLLVE